MNNINRKSYPVNTAPIAPGNSNSDVTASAKPCIKHKRGKGSSQRRTLKYRGELTPEVEDQLRIRSNFSKRHFTVMYLYFETHGIPDECHTEHNMRYDFVEGLKSNKSIKLLDFVNIHGIPWEYPVAAFFTYLHRNKLCICREHCNNSLQLEPPVKTVSDDNPEEEINANQSNDHGFIDEKNKWSDQTNELHPYYDNASSEIFSPETETLETRVQDVHRPIESGNSISDHKNTCGPSKRCTNVDSSTIDIGNGIYTTQHLLDAKYSQVKDDLNTDCVRENFKKTFGFSDAKMKSTLAFFESMKTSKFRVNKRGVLTRVA